MRGTRTVEKGVEGVDGVKGPGPGPLGPLNILCHKNVVITLYLCSALYGNLFSLKGYLQELSSLMTVFISETKPSYGYF